MWKAQRHLLNGHVVTADVWEVLAAYYFPGEDGLQLAATPDPQETAQTHRNNLTDKANLRALVSDEENACPDMIYVKVNKVSHCFIISRSGRFAPATEELRMQMNSTRVVAHAVFLYPPETGPENPVRGKRPALTSPTLKRLPWDHFTECTRGQKRNKWAQVANPENREEKYR